MAAMNEEIDILGEFRQYIRMNMAEYVARIPPPRKRYAPPRQAIANERLPATCGRDVNYLLGNILKRNYRDGDTIKYVFFWEFDDSLFERPELTIEDVNIKKEDGKYYSYLAFNDTEEAIYRKAVALDIPVLGTIGIDHFVDNKHVNGHVFPYLLLDDTLILLETYDTFNRGIFGGKYAHTDAIARCLDKGLDMASPETSTYHASYGEKIAYGGLLTVYRPVIIGKINSYDLQRRDTEYTSLGFCPMWSVVLLKRVSMLDLTHPIGEILAAIKGIYAELDAQIDRPGGLHDLFAEFYGSHGGRRKTRKRR